ncbi:MAG: DNA topoisomerase IV subunit B [Flavobacteriales bacterium]
MVADAEYTEDNIRSLDWKEHIRLRPGMYIGKLGDGSAADDGIYILLKEVIDNSIDEFVMGNGKVVEVKIKDKKVTVRDYGRGIPLGKVIDCVSIINTGGKYDSRAFKKSVGLNGVGTKAVNALSTNFEVSSFREDKVKRAEFEKGNLTKDHKIEASTQRKGTLTSFIPDEKIFHNFQFRTQHVQRMMWNYVYLNPGLTIYFNGEKFYSENGLKDLLTMNLSADVFYPIIHLKGEDIEVAITHAKKYGEEYYSFVNGQHTTQGGTHQGAFREMYVKTIREFFGKEFEAVDVRQSLVAAISVKVIEPVFESQTKTKLGSQEIEPGGTSMKTFVGDFLKRELDNFLHKNPQVADELLRQIQRSERERKDLAGIRKIARENAKKASLHNKKLRDCKIHFNDEGGGERIMQTTLFITEGDSASGSITKSRDVQTQAVFSLRGKPLNVYGLTKKVVYENEEFNLLQAALNIEESLDDLRYNQVVIATDADVDGMHIRLLLVTFFLQFFPELVSNGHVYILQTPLFRVRNRQETRYCYSEEERLAAVTELKKPEITRFKGLGEISPDEFKNFINENIRLEPVVLGKDSRINELLEFYMGKNTPDRQTFIMDNLRVEKDVEEDLIPKK